MDSVRPPQPRKTKSTPSPAKKIKSAREVLSVSQKKSRVAKKPGHSKNPNRSVRLEQVSKQKRRVKPKVVSQKQTGAPIQSAKIERAVIAVTDYSGEYSVIPDEQAILAHAEQALKVDSLQKNLQQQESARIAWERKYEREVERRYQLEDYLKKLEAQFVRYLNKISGRKLDLVPGLSKPASGRRMQHARISKMWRQSVAPTKRTLIIFTLVTLFFVSVIGGTGYIQQSRLTGTAALDSARVAFENLKTATQALTTHDYETAEQALAQAREDFKQARADVAQVGNLLLGFVAQLPGAGQIKDSLNLLEAGELLTDAGREALVYWQRLQKIRLQTNFTNTTVAEKLVLNEDTAQAEDLAILLTDLEQVWPDLFKDLTKALNLLEKVRAESLPEEYRADFADLQKIMPDLSVTLKNLADLPQIARHLFGLDDTQYYLLLFQNSAELRATGGFIGTYGLLNMQSGRVTRLEVNGIYDPDGQLKRNIAAPEGLSRMVERLYIRDANWWPDFPTSAQKISELFMEATTYKQIDGVMAFTPAVIQAMLKQIGSLVVPGYEVELTADNFLLETQVQVEQVYDRTLNKPKQFLADALPLLMEKFFAQENSVAKFMQIFTAALRVKDIQMYFTASQLQEFVLAYNWGGALNKSANDLLYIVNSNIQSLKSDQFIKQSVKHTVKIEPAGTVEANVQLTRQHTGTTAWPSGDNISYLRLVVPETAQLIAAEGFEAENYFDFIYNCHQCEVDPLIAQTTETTTVDEASKTHISTFLERTIFANWLKVKPQSAKMVEIRYQMPLNIAPARGLKTGQGYSLLLQKQPGSGPIDYDLTIEYPSLWDVSWTGGTVLEKTGNTLRWQGELTKDEIFGMVFVQP